MIKELLTNNVKEKYISDIILKYKEDIEIYEEVSYYLIYELIYIYKCFKYLKLYFHNNIYNVSIFYKNNDMVSLVCGFELYYFQIVNITNNKCIYCNNSYDIFDNIFNNKLFNYNSLENMIKNIKICKNDSCNKYFYNYFKYDFNNLELLDNNYDYNYIYNNLPIDSQLLINQKLKIYKYCNII
jgi:hypothetical protein